MKMRSMVLGVTLAALVAGCAAQGTMSGVTPGALPPAAFAIEAGRTFTAQEAEQVFAQAQAAARAALPGYRVLSDAEQALGVTEVSSSSVRNDYFRLSYVTDGNTHSAWAPAASDPDPSLTFQLTETFQLSAMEVKLSPAGVMMDVAVSQGGGEWTTVATDLTPGQYEAMSRVNLPAAQGDRVKITFHGVASKDLLVCEVHWFGQPAPVATPTPSATPTPGPVVTPTPKPEDCGIGIKGVGTIGGGCAPTTFAFLGASTPGKGVSGFVYVKTAGKLYLGKVSVIQQQGRTFTLSGTLSGSGKAFTLVAVEGSTLRDTVTFSTEDHVEFTGTLRCGDIRFTELPCDVKTVKSPCKTRRWGTCVSQVPHDKRNHDKKGHDKRDHDKKDHDKKGHDNKKNNDRDDRGKSSGGKDHHARR